MGLKLAQLSRYKGIPSKSAAYSSRFCSLFLWLNYPLYLMINEKFVWNSWSSKDYRIFKRDTYIYKDMINHQHRFPFISWKSIVLYLSFTLLWKCRSILFTILVDRDTTWSWFLIFISLMFFLYFHNYIFRRNIAFVCWRAVKPHFTHSLTHTLTIYWIVKYSNY